MHRIRRLNIVNSITGVKPANLIGTRSLSGSDNVAIFSSVVHLGSDPPLIGFVSRPKGEVARHTLENISETKKFTINHVRTDLVANAHLTSAKFKRDESEFEKCGIENEFINGFHAPFVRQSEVKIAMSLKDRVPIESNGTVLIIGEVEFVFIEPTALTEEGYIDLEFSRSAGISGLNSYYALKKLSDFPYARPENAEEILENGR